MMVGKTLIASSSSSWFTTNGETHMGAGPTTRVDVLRVLPEPLILGIRGEREQATGSAIVWWGGGKRRKIQ